MQTDYCKIWKLQIEHSEMISFKHYSNCTYTCSHVVQGQEFCTKNGIVVVVAVAETYVEAWRSHSIDLGE